MKKRKEVMKKYKSIFGIEKDYLEILRECHLKMTTYKTVTFTLVDFKSKQNYKDNLSFIDSYRKYSEMDDFLLGVNEYSLIPLESTGQLSQKITYHDIMEAIDLFNESFEKMSSFYVKKNAKDLNTTLAFHKVLTINDVFHFNNVKQFSVYFIESARKYCFGAIYQDYEYIHYLPFETIDLDSEEEQNSIVFGYLYLIQEYLVNHHQDIAKDKNYTTIYQEYGVSYDEYLKKPVSSKYVVYNNNLKDFLIEPEGLTYYPRMNQLRFDVVDLLAETKPQHEDFYCYFKLLKFDKKKAEEYVRQNWILNHDIGRIYKINYNMVGTKEEVEKYKEQIIQRKIDDIELNFQMYRKHGLIKYNQEKDRGLQKDRYTAYLKEYIEQFNTDKSNFKNGEDKRIDLDTNPIFRIGKSGHMSHQYSANSFDYPNITINDCKLFGEVKKPVIIQVNLENFISSYNDFKGSDLLQMNYEWYFPYKQLHDYVENTIQSFCHIRLTSGVREEEFRVLRDVFFYEGKDKKKILEHPDFIYDTKKYTLQSRNPYYFEIPVIINLQMDMKEFNLIQKGIHPLFKSECSEKNAQNERLKLASAERFLSKKEIVNQSDYEVIYTGQTRKSNNLHKGIKGKIVSVEKGITIVDELGKTHKETFKSIQKSGWRHLSTMDLMELINTLSLSEKAFLEKQRTVKLENKL